MVEQNEEKDKKSCGCGSHCGCGKILAAIFIFAVGLLIGISLGGRWHSKCGMMDKGMCCSGHMMPDQPAAAPAAPKK